jgi:hypothetical protein
MAKVKTLKCEKCGGEMIPRTVARHSPAAVILLLVFGLIFCFLGLFTMGITLIIGIPLLIIGFLLGVQTRGVWLCKDCRTMIDRQKKFWEL